jgi:hypothetical protein
MESLVNAFLGIGLLVVILLIVYLVDRVNALERETRRLSQPPPPPAPMVADPWSGLSGKALWDAMTGRPPAYLSAVALQDLRQNYEVVLYKHIHALFDEGVQDGRLGVTGEPRNTRTIRTAQGEVESWLPAPQANTLYRCGLEATQHAGEDLTRVRQALDEAGQQLFEKTQLTQSEPLSAGLMPGPVSPVAAPAAGAGVAAAPAAPASRPTI